VVPKQIRRCPEHDPRRAPVALDDVVGDEAMSAQDELERALALSDSALAEQEKPDTEDVDEDTVQRRLRGKPIVQHSMYGVDRAARTTVRNEKGCARGHRGGDEGAGRLLIAGDDDAGKTQREKASRGRDPSFAIE
jgi:hypothetical protein